MVYKMDETIVWPCASIKTEVVFVKLAIPTRALLEGFDQPIDIR